MGGAVVRHEPNSRKALENCDEACQIFREARWIKFFERLKGSEESVVLEFARNLERNKTEVRGLNLEVVAKVTILHIGGK